MDDDENDVCDDDFSSIYDHYSECLS
jgi:hypothetical protein